jgi:hypothetical protein
VGEIIIIIIIIIKSQEIYRLKRREGNSALVGEGGTNAKKMVERREYPTEEKGADCCMNFAT